MRRPSNSKRAVRAGTAQIHGRRSRVLSADDLLRGDVAVELWQLRQRFDDAARRHLRELIQGDGGDGRRRIHAALGDARAGDLDLFDCLLCMHERGRADRECDGGRYGCHAK
jgi:hypothetical protein